MTNTQHTPGEYTKPELYFSPAPLPCARCEIRFNAHPDSLSNIRVQFCPLHAQAPAMLEALRTIVDLRGRRMASSADTLQLLDPCITEARAIIADIEEGA